MRKSLIYLLGTLLLASCLENDIPYPKVVADITAMSVEYQCDEDGSTTAPSTKINKSERTVEMYVDDRVSLADVRITQLQVSNDARISLCDAKLCAMYDRFPKKGFAAPQADDCTQVDFTRPVKFCLSTYQDYEWTVTVKQVLGRELLLDLQDGDPIIDDLTHSVVIYVDESVDLAKVKVNKFKLAGTHGTVTPDIAKAGTCDFTHKVYLDVKYAYQTEPTRWAVNVFRRKSSGAKGTAFPWTTRAYFSGTLPGGRTLDIEYSVKDAVNWQKVDGVKVDGTRFEAELLHLEPNTTYTYRFVTNGETGEEKDFTTAPATKLTGGDFDNWHSTVASSRKDLWNPWVEGSESFWDTGNRGATTVGASNSVPTDETCNGRGKAAFLESKYIVIKFAAGNIFTGAYKKTDGTNGILDFGRPFTGFPTALRVNYKYQTSTIKHSADAKYEYLKGRPDSCQIYIALADWDQPLEIRTNPKNQSLFSPTLPGVIAYSSVTIGHDVPQWTQQDLVLDYYAKDRTPKYILIVVSSSKYGDFFAGGDGSKLWVDNFELIYD